MSAQTALPSDHDLLPPVPDSGALEPKKKKHKPGTLRRALSWLRGRKKKKPEAKQQERKDNSKPDGEAQQTPAQEDEPTDNAFFPSGRTPFLHEIHNQAQEGLKSLQRREKQHNKTPSQDDKTPEPSSEANEDDFRVRSLSCTTENTDDAMYVRSEMIQRKGSTFKPYDSPRSGSSRVGRKRKDKRATVVGVPQHIASELGIHSTSSHRGIHELFPRDRQPNEKAAIPVVNGIQRQEEEFVIIPTVDGNPAVTLQDGAHVSVAALEQTDAALQRHIDKLYRDDSCIGWKSGPKISPLLLRPKSLAVPGMTTHFPQSEPMTPVMSISPQATYMSKIIPNAVLPHLVDVVALSHSSVRTLSRCSLATASPASVRGSLHRGRGMSFSSGTWSRSQSTETIVSDSSTISSKGGENIQEANERQESRLNAGRASPSPSTGTQDGSDAASLCSGRSSVRSVSLRKNKKAPPPPKRTYSLQQQREMGLPPRPDKKPSAKNSNARDPWILRTDKVTVDNYVFLPPLAGPIVSSPSRSDRTLSPSSGYSSQSGTPTMPIKALLDSPGLRRKTPPKPERSSLKSAASILESSTSSAENHSPLLVNPSRAGSSMGDQERLYQIPPHPNVPAPSCPPPSLPIDLNVTAVATPPPSPPPSHHPTPPAARKSESDTEIPPLTLEATKQKESVWPPPPPDTTEDQDLSMADFPPPDEELFLPPPPLSLDSISIFKTSPVIVNANNKKEEPEAKTHLLISNDEKSLNTVMHTQSGPVPLIPSDPPDTAANPLTAARPTVSVPRIAIESQEPSSLEPVTVPTTTADPSAPIEGLIVYKPYFAAKTSTLKPECEEPLETTVPQEFTADESVTNREPNVSNSDSVGSESSPPVESSVAIAPPSVAATSSVLPHIPGSPRPMSSVWKINSASSSRKASTNQTITAALIEDANSLIVTPSLLQMVRLRSVQARGPQSPFSQPTSGLPAPQKPVRKSLSLRSSQGSDSSPAESPTTPSQSPQKPTESPSAHRSSASAASFVFARGSRKFVFEPPASQEAETTLKKDLVAELKAHGDPRSPDGKPPLQRKPTKIPPPVPRKPSVGLPNTPTSPSHSVGGTNGSACILPDSALPPVRSGTNAPVTQTGQEKPHKSPTEQA